MNDGKISKSAAKMNALLMQGICGIGTKLAGEAIGRDPSFISRLKTGETKVTTEEFCTLLDACGLTILEITDDSITIKRSMYESLTEFADVGLKFLRAPE